MRSSLARSNPPPKPLRMVWTPPSPEAIATWVAHLGAHKSAPCAIIVGPTPAHRFDTYRLVERDTTFDVVLDKSLHCRNWTEGLLVDNISRRIAVQRILRELIETPELVVDKTLETVIDNGFMRVHEGFKILWEARFLAMEGAQDQVERIIQALTRWTAGCLTEYERGSLEVAGGQGVQSLLTSTPDRYDVLLMWLTLARDNGQFDRIILPLDGLEDATDRVPELLDLLQAVERWTPLGSPLGLLLGFSKSPDEVFPFLQKYVL